MRLALLATIPLLASVFAGTGCSGDSGEPTTAKTADGGTLQISAACAAETRKDIYTAGLTKPASDLSVDMTESVFLPSGAAAVPGPVQKGMNSVTIQVLDANKQPLDGASVSLVLLMPDHGHGSAVTPTTAAKGSGTYEIDNVWLSMAGLWNFKFSVVPAGGGAAKIAEFNFCVDG